MYCNGTGWVHLYPKEVQRISLENRNTQHGGNDREWRSVLQPWELSVESFNMFVVLKPRKKIARYFPLFSAL
jgi:hypothetical protein